VIHFWTPKTIERYQQYAPCGQLPVYHGDELGRDTILCQEGAICRHIARITDLYGSNTREQAQIEMIFELSKDIEAARLGDTLAFQKSLRAASRLLGDSTYFVSSNVTLADIAMFRHLHFLHELDAQSLHPHPNLGIFVHSMSNLPEIKQYLESERRLPLTRGEVEVLPFPYKYEFLSKPDKMLACAQTWHSSAHDSVRVLAFHGGGSNAEVFRYQCKQIELALASSKGCWEFLQGTHECSHIVDPLANVIDPHGTKFSWYEVAYGNNEQPQTMEQRAANLSSHVTYDGIREELLRLQSFVEDQECYDIFFAFSQGAVIATLLLQCLPKALLPSLVVLASPIPPLDKEYEKHLFPFAAKINVPCLVVHGNPGLDFAHRFGEYVSNCFASSVMFIHNEGHVVPQNVENVHELLARLRPMLLTPVAPKTVTSGTVARDVVNL